MEEYSKQKLNELYYNRLEFPQYKFLGFKYKNIDISPYCLDINSDSYKSLPFGDVISIIPREHIPANYRRRSDLSIYVLTAEEYNSLLIIKELSR